MSMDMADWVSYGFNLLAIILVLFVRWITKGDISKITEKIESVKMLYQEYGFRYKKEYEILCEISAALVVLRDYTYDLRPEFGYGIDPNIADAKIQEENIKKEKLEVYFIKHTEFYLLVEQNRPFYSNDVYKVMAKITVLGKDEINEYFRGYNSNDRDMSHKYWESSSKNRKEMKILSDKAVETIRLRVESWSGIDSEKV